MLTKETGAEYDGVEREKYGPYIRSIKNVFREVVEDGGVVVEAFFHPVLHHRLNEFRGCRKGRV